MKKSRKLLAALLVLVLAALPFGAMTARAAESTVRVWFYNSEGWDAVSAYVYGAPEGEVLGGWPGAAATEEAGGWWYIDVPSETPFNLIFNNNNNGAQAGGIYVENTELVYATVKADKKYASKAEAEASLSGTVTKPEPGAESTRVWFYNSESWQNINAYVYGAPEGEVLGGWPGAAATEEAGGWWYIDVPGDTPFNIIFNNGQGAQAGGAYIDDDAAVYVNIAADGKYTGKAEAEAAVEEKPDVDDSPVKVWFFNSDGWSEVYAYIWGAAETDPLGAWPGTKCIRESPDSHWYYIECPCGAPFNFIVNNNSEKQTQGVRIEDRENVYTTINDDVKFASREEAEATIDEVKEIIEGGDENPETALTLWFYNDAEWENVYAYLLSADGKELMGAAPGVKMQREGMSNWYFVNVSAELGYTVRYSDGDAKRSAELKIDDGSKIYAAQNALYASKAEAEALFKNDTAEPTDGQSSAGNGGSKTLTTVLVVAGVLAVAAGAVVTVVTVKKKKQKA